MVTFFILLIMGGDYEPETKIVLMIFAVIWGALLDITVSRTLKKIGE